MIYKHKDLRLNTKSWQFFVDDVEVELSYTEFLIMKTLLIKKGDVVSRDDIYKNIHKDKMLYTNIIDVYINYIRKKIGVVNDTQYIKTIRNVGYKLN